MQFVMASCMDLVCTSGAKTSLSSLRIVQSLQDLKLGISDLFTNQLSDPVSLLDQKLCVRVVEHYHTCNELVSVILNSLSTQ